MKKVTGKEARYILRQHRINMADLAQKLGISPQSLNSRLNADEFSRSRMLEINTAVGEQIFEIELPASEKIPILGINGSGGFGVGQEGDETKVIEYVTIPSLKDCVGIILYGDSMLPNYMSGDVIFVKKKSDYNVIDFGRAYLVITKDDRFVKCVLPSKRDESMLRLSSFNKDTDIQGERIYPDFEISKTDILQLYKVVGSLRREQI